MGTCTIIAFAKGAGQTYAACLMPIKLAITQADTMHATNEYSSVRVFAESANGDLTLIYVPTGKE